MNTWSDSLKEQTRNAILEFWTGAPDGFLHMKNINGRFGKIRLHDLITEKLLIQDKETDAEYLYSTADELIEAGWAID